MIISTHEFWEALLFYINKQVYEAIFEFAG